jgi:hypothetical protein
MHAFRNYRPQLPRRSIWILSTLPVTCKPMYYCKCPKYFVGIRLKFISLKYEKNFDWECYWFRECPHGREKSLLTSSCFSVCLSVWPSVRLSISRHVSTLFPPDRFPRNSILKTFVNISLENTSLLKSGKNIGRFTRRPKYVLLLLATWNRYKKAGFELNVTRILGHPWLYKHHAKAP